MNCSESFPKVSWLKVPTSSRRQQVPLVAPGSCVADASVAPPCQWNQGESGPLAPLAEASQRRGCTVYKEILEFLLPTFLLSRFGERPKDWCSSKCPSASDQPGSGYLHLTWRSRGRTGLRADAGQVGCIPPEELGWFTFPLPFPLPLSPPGY